MRIDSRASGADGEGHVRRLLKPPIIQAGEEGGLDPSGSIGGEKQWVLD